MSEDIKQFDGQNYYSFFESVLNYCLTIEKGHGIGSKIIEHFRKCVSDDGHPISELLYDLEFRPSNKNENNGNDDVIHCS
jgi:hypothetical protein